MKNIIVILFLLIAFSNVYSDEIVTLKNSKKVILKNNGTWSYLNVSKKENEGNYSEIKFIDLKLDINSLNGKKIKTRAVAQFFAGMLMLKQGMMDMNPLIVNVKSISREARKYLLTGCNISCTLTVYGTVGEVQFQKGIIAEKIEWK